MSWIILNLNWIVPAALNVVFFALGYLLKSRKEAKTSRVKEIDRLKAENSSLKTELEKLKDNEAFKQSLTYVDTGFYFKESGDGTANEYYCAKCLDSDSKRIHINIQEDGDYICPVCKNTGLFNEKMRDDYFDKYSKKMSSDYDWQVQNFLTYDGK